MIRSTRTKSFAAWLGILALAVAALVPVETARASAPEAVVLCTGHGTVPADQGGAPAGQAHDRAHCECCLHAPPIALGPSQGTVALRRVPVLPILPPDIDAAGIERVSSKQPRAPPTV